MKKVLLSCIALAAGATMAMAQDVPQFPENLGVTLNGETSLPGVEIRQDDPNGDGSLLINISGTCDVEEVTVTFATPEGWDELMIMDFWGDGVVSTRSDDEEIWLTKEQYSNMNFQDGNSVTYVIDGNSQEGEIALVKDGMVYYKTIRYVFDVTNGAGDEPGNDDPLFPESVGITESAAGLNIEQTPDYENGQINIEITGEIEEPTFDVVLDVPEGWDGFISMVEYGDVVIGEGITGGLDPKMTRSEDDWMPLEEAESEGEKGNKFTFTANGERSNVWTYLYKGDRVYLANCININANVTKYVDPDLAAANQAAYDAVIAQLDELQAKYDAAVTEIKETNPNFDLTEWEEIGNMIEQYKGWALQALESANVDGSEFQFPFDGEEIDAYITMMMMAGKPAPAFPESFDVALSNSEGVEVNQYLEQEVYTIAVSGKSLQDELTLTLTVPEGWDGFICMTENGSDIEPLSTRAQETEWWPMEDLLEFGATETNSMTFPVDGEEHYGQFLLVKDGMADVNNQINVEFVVEYDYIKANQQAFDEVMAEINAASSNYTEAINFIESYNPEFEGLEEMKQIIGEAISQATTGAEQALAAANEEGESFFFPFSAEEINAMIAEMKVQAVEAPNKAAYDETVAAIEKSKADYETALKDLKDKNPDFDFKEWEELIEYVLNDAKKEAEKALNNANAEGTAYSYAFDGKVIEALIKEMGEEVESSGVGSVNAADNAAYYDLNGNKINNPKAGMYIKVVDGKATKVFVNK